ncbi:MAG: hypothetical protein R2793_04145 [Flavobacteriaceae bacterium]
MSINQIVTPLDSAVLETKEQYQVYFKIVTHAFGELFKSIQARTICNPLEISFLEQYFELITYSLEAFRVKYLYNEEDKMKIDLTESGFPNYLEFRYLVNDLELKNEHISKLPKVEVLKEEFLESILKYKTAVPKRKLEQAASIVYYTSVDARYIFKRFVQGKIQKIENNPEAPYLISWSFYDVSHNRPFVCFMYFNLHKTTVEEYTKEIYDVLEKVADRDMSLDMMAYGIDKKLPKLLPKKLRKIDLGPIHSVFAKDELEATHCIMQGIVNKVLDLSAHAISLSIEDLETKGNFKEGNFFNKQELQIWEAQKPKKYLFSPHRVMQVFYDRIPEYINTLTEEPIEIPALTL